MLQYGRAIHADGLFYVSIKRSPIERAGLATSPKVVVGDRFDLEHPLDVHQRPPIWSQVADQSLAQGRHARLVGCTERVQQIADGVRILFAFNPLNSLFPGEHNPKGVILAKVFDELVLAKGEARAFTGVFAQ
jgi:hypothetical protein